MIKKQIIYLHRKLQVYHNIFLISLNLIRQAIRRETKINLNK